MIQSSKKESNMTEEIKGPNLYLAVDNTWARYEVRSISAHGQTILSLHLTLDEAQEQIRHREARGEIVIIYDAETEEPIFAGDKE
tara:strand:- start:427 stop:681 length:255 start_codon:yes stop_codon:yes gene_type:complete